MVEDEKSVRAKKLKEAIDNLSRLVGFDVWDDNARPGDGSAPPPKQAGE